MPFSSNSGKRLVDRAIMRIVKQMGSRFFQEDPVILDVGAGSGTYSDRYSKTWLPRDKFTWNAIEVWIKYIPEYKLIDKYSTIHTVKAQDYFAEERARVDVCFMGDVLEHMTKEDAIAIVNSALNFCGAVIISLPIGHYPQDEYQGNPYEKHIVDNWDVESALSAFSNVVFYGVDKEIGVFICSKIFENELRELLAPQVGAYGICKDEYEFIERCVRSLDEADKIIICDTGSSDGTYNRLLELARDVPQLQVERICVAPWRFDDARNCALFSMPEEIDVCISIDADELLEPGFIPQLKKLVDEDLRLHGAPSDRYHHRFKTVWDWKSNGKNISEHWHERVHSRHGYRWKLPVHEILVKTEPESIRWITEIMMTQLPDTAKPRSSYLRLLEISVNEDPMIWKSWSFLANEYQAVGRYEDAIRALSSALSLENSDKAYLYYQLSKLEEKRSRFDEAIYAMRSAVKSAPSVREYLVYLAQVCMIADRRSDAVSALSTASKITQRTYGYEYNPQCWGEPFDVFFKSVKGE